jgi:hypothetical protein
MDKRVLVLFVLFAVLYILTLKSIESGRTPEVLAIPFLILDLPIFLITYPGGCTDQLLCITVSIIYWGIISATLIRIFDGISKKKI